MKLFWRKVRNYPQKRYSRKAGINPTMTQISAEMFWFTVVAWGFGALEFKKGVALQRSWKVIYIYIHTYIYIILFKGDARISNCQKPASEASELTQNLPELDTPSGVHGCLDHWRTHLLHTGEHVDFDAENSQKRTYDRSTPWSFLIIYIYIYCIYTWYIHIYIYTVNLSDFCVCCKWLHG